jgi:small subunit ribosomal protein S6
MIYETAFVLRADATEDAIKKAKENALAAIKEFDGEVLIDENWGVKQFAQPTSNGLTRGNYFYIMYKAKDGSLNVELERRFRIDESVLKFIFIALGKDEEQEAVMKGYKNPNNASSEAGRDLDKDRKMFSRRKSCWFSAKKTSPDWKDPNSYAWLVNEFGKISPARVTGLRPKYQRMATTAIKRGRAMGMISYISNHTFR